MKGFIYVQRTGELAIVNGDHETPLCVGSAGAEGGRNNPAMQHVRNIGPLPQGRYHMRIVDHRRFAAPAIRLDWDEEANREAGMANFGRSGFYIHGGTKSEGCILLNGCARTLVATGVKCGHDSLLVVGEAFPFGINAFFTGAVAA